MTGVQRRFKKVIGRFGEAFTVGATNGTGIVTPIPSGVASIYLASDELSAATRPIRMAYVAYDDVTAVNASLGTV